MNQCQVLIVHYSQTDQLSRVLQSVASPLEAHSDCEVTYWNLQPLEPYPFPWPFIRFFDTFPETVHEKGCALAPVPEEVMNKDYDLVILGYQVWFLSPSIPITAFLQSEEAKRLLVGTPVVTVIACRDMWLSAQERVKAYLEHLKAPLVGNIALTDAAGSALSFLATPFWLLTGHKGPFPLGIPKAGVADEDITSASRFGSALLARLQSPQSLDATVLEELGAVKINVKLIASETLAKRGFKLWGRVFLACGPAGCRSRKILVIFYSLFTLSLILTLVPLSALFKKVFSPLMCHRDDALRTYYAAPSGEARKFH